MPVVKVLVVDDSAFMRKVITDIINNDPHLEVIGKARDGRDAIKKIKELRPDVVTMDIEMPGLDGLSALAIIMEEIPVPTIMLSSLTKIDAGQTVKALSLGAVDFITKPSGQISLDIDIVKDEIIEKIKTAAGTKKNLQNFSIIGNFVEDKTTKKDSVIDEKKLLKKIVVIGTSTGGPKALHQVIPNLPKNIDAAILIVQHMPPGFTKSLAERLDSISNIRVKEAEDNEVIVPGCAYIAPGDYHLFVKAKDIFKTKHLYVSLNQLPPFGGHRPSADLMFSSVVEQFWGHTIGVIMTGMGRDGAEGLAQIKDHGGLTIAEHESSCIVYGMPKAAVQTDKVDEVVPLENISEKILQLL
ncbi:MAG TPA: chemotaxis response regulator protein-glutamate methylesterase [Syntrophomonadaceae bacterium]|nr:chemotaxis response regulator protein-glutamate methylesterase [Syntrophomonadaceae bacterium]